MDTLGGRHETHWSSHKYAHYVVENSCAQSVKLHESGRQGSGPPFIPALC